MLLAMDSTTLAAAAALARSTRNRGRTHIFLGDPCSDAGDKTTVEPGNACSPGVWTCGVTLWLEAGAGWTTADLQPEAAVAWELISAPGEAPVVTSHWAHAGLLIRHRLCHVGGEGSEGLDAAEVTVSSDPGDPADQARSVTLAVAVTDRGPAGGYLQRLTWDAAKHTLHADGARIVIETPATALVLPPDARWDTPVGVAAVTVAVAPGHPACLRYRIHHGFANRLREDLAPRNGRRDHLHVQATFAAAATEWTSALPARIFAPDPRVALAWERCAWHVLAAMEVGIPRIGAVNYPTFWLRDGVLILRALDLIGRHDLARIGCDWIAPVEFAGGFGAEADAPGEGIWALVSHARMTRDQTWLAEQWPFIRRRLRTYERMLTTTTPLRTITDNRLSWVQHSPAGSISAMPAQHGLVHGRMDWHHPDFFINCWGQSGLVHGAEAARAAGDAVEAERLAALAREIDDRIARHLLPHYGNDRDPIIAPWPSGALATHRAALRERFEAWYRAHRLLPDGRRKPEPDWSYFEAAQAHNAILLGMVEEGWTCLNGLIARPSGPWDVSAYGEGPAGGNEFLPYGNHHPTSMVIEARGWLDQAVAVNGNMPHNWTTAEVLAALRDCLVVERDGHLALGVGIPRAWRTPGARCGGTSMPTDLGLVSFTITFDGAGQPTLTSYDGPADPLLALPV